MREVLLILVVVLGFVCYAITQIPKDMRQGIQPRLIKIEKDVADLKTSLSEVNGNMLLMPSCPSKNPC